jgi:beta-lactamase regulating signal transducer with metallopeptidase domain
MTTILRAALDLAAALAPHALELLGRLARAAAMGTLFVLAVWILCRLAPRLTAGLRCALWWLACLKLLLGLIWPTPLALPLLPPISGHSAAAGLVRWLASEQSTKRSQLRAPSLAPAVSPGLAEGSRSPRPRMASGRTPLPACAGAFAKGDASSTANTFARGSASTGAPRSTPAAPAATRITSTRSLHSSRGSTRSQPARWLGGGSAAMPPALPAMPWWALALAAAWIAGLLLQIGWTARELWRVRRFLRGSAPVRDESVLRLAGDLVRALELPPVELRCAPDAAELAAPLTAGALHPVVVLPAAGLDRLSRQELAMTLGHELMHVRRRDLLWGWLPAAAARLFFFLPPAALAAREYALAREAACDAGVVRLLGAAPASYGRLLVRLGARGPATRAGAGLLPHLSPASVASAGAASSLHQLKRRLEMLQHHSQPLSTRPAPLRRLGFCLLALLATAALLPLRIVAAAPSRTAAPTLAPAAAAGPALAIAGAAVSTLTPAATAGPFLAPAATAVPVLATAGAAGPVVAPASAAAPVMASPTTASPLFGRLAVPDPALRPMLAASLGRRDLADPESGAAAQASPDETMNETSAMTPPEPPEPPEPPQPPEPPDSPLPPAMDHGHQHVSGHVHMHSTGRTHGDVYVLLHGQNDVMMSGSTEDFDRTRELRRKTGGGDILWTRRDGKQYVVRDPATLQAVRELFRPQAELGDQQGKLGDQQGKLGDEQGQLGDRQGELGDRQGALGEEQARLASEEATLAAEASSGDGRTAEARERRRQELREAQRKLEREMTALGAQQRELGAKQRELGQRQSQLGRRQSALGREQERVSREAEAKLHTLLDQAIATGTAKEVK